MKFPGVLYLSIILILTLCTQCEKHEVTSRAYPRLKTLDVTDISDEGATFRAQFLQRGDFTILSHGFVWWILDKDRLPTIELAEKYIDSDPVSDEGFKKEVFTTLREGIVYEVRAFVETAEYLVYGNPVSFVSLGSKSPIIDEISPIAGTIADTIQIRGKGFSYLNSSCEVLFDTLSTAVVSLTDTLITVIVPDLSKETYNISVSVLSNKSVFEEAFEVTTPSIESFYPRSQSVDDTITISGARFSHHEGSNLLTLGGVESIVTFATKDEIRAVVPAGVPAQSDIVLTIAGQTTTASTKFEFLQPEITGVEPSTIFFEDTVRISGNHFSFIKDHNQVYIDEQQVELLDASKTEIRFTFPAEIEKSNYSINVRVAGRTLSIEDLQIPPPVLFTIDPQLIDSYGSTTMYITGNNLNPVPEMNVVHLDDMPVTVTSVTPGSLTVAVPDQLIPNQWITFRNTFDVHLRILDQETALQSALTVDYQSVWTRKKDFPGEPRQQLIQFAAADQIFVGLGRRFASNYGDLAKMYSDLWAFDPASNTWSRKADFPGPPRSAPAVFEINGKAYVVGGRSTTWNGQSYIASFWEDVWSYDVQADTWSRKNDFPGAARAETATFAVDGVGYLCGGRVQNDASTKNTKEVWEYVPGADSWYQNNDGPDTFIDYPSIALHGNGYVFTPYFTPHGYYSYTAQSDTWQYHTIEAFYSWIFETIMLVGDDLYSSTEDCRYIYHLDLSAGKAEYFRFYGHARTYANVIGLHDKGYILLGNGYGQYLSDVWEFDPTYF